MGEKLLEKKVDRIFFLDEQGFCRKDISKKLKISYSIVCSYLKAKKEDFESPYEYKKDQVEKRTKKSFSDYRKEQEGKRQKNPKNKKLVKIINEGLERTGMTQSQLAREIGESRALISLYAQGKSFPKDEETLKMIFCALELSYKPDWYV